MARILERRNDTTGRVSLDIPVELRDTHFEDAFEADCVNLSTGGLSLRSPCLPDVGSTLECRFTSVDRTTEVAARGEVVWAQLDGERSGEFGLRFVGVSVETELLIEEMLAEYCAHRPPSANEAAPAVVHLELEGTNEAITAELARDGRGTATFEQKLDLLQLGRAIRARQARGEERHGEIAAVELKLVGNTPMLAVTVDFEQREYGEFDAFASDGLESDEEHDTAPDLEAPGTEAAPESRPPLQPVADRFSHTTETEFARAPQATPQRLDATPVVRVESTPSEVELPASLAAPDPYEEAMFHTRQSEVPGVDPGHPGEGRAQALESDASDDGWDDASEDAAGQPARGAPTESADARGALAARAAHEARSGHEVRADRPGVGASGADAWRQAAGEADEPGLILEPPSALDRVHALLRRALVVVGRVAGMLLGAAAQSIGRALPRVRGIAIRLRGTFSALYRERLATGVGAARRLLAPRLPKRRRRTTAVPATRGRAQAPGAARPIAMGVLGAAAVALGAYALIPAGDSEAVLHRQVAPPRPLPEGAATAPVTAEQPSRPASEVTAMAPTGPATAAASPTLAPPTPPVASPTRGGVVFGQAQVPDAKQFTLRMSARVETLKGIPDEGGFTVIIPGSLSLDRAGPISASHRAIRRSMILNKGDRSELTIRFAEGKKPRYQVRAVGNQLEIRIQDV